MKALVLAAGEGKRLQPLTATRSKHMIAIAGKPILEHVLLAIKENGIKDVLIITNYYEKHIKQYFSDGSAWGLKLDYVHQKELLGTAHAQIEPRRAHVTGELVASGHPQQGLPHSRDPLCGDAFGEGEAAPAAEGPVDSRLAECGHIRG